MKSTNRLKKMNMNIATVTPIGIVLDLRLMFLSIAYWLVCHWSKNNPVDENKTPDIIENKIPIKRTIRVKFSFNKFKCYCPYYDFCENINYE